MLRTLMTMRVLKYSVQTQIFCQCGSILDCTRSILADVEYDGSTVTMFTCCAKCWETRSETRIRDGYQHARNKIAMGIYPDKHVELLTLTITDGRTLDWDLDDEAERMGL